MIRQLLLNILSITLPVILTIPVMAQQNRVSFNDQQLFLNGLNLAWRQFADDIGPSSSTPDLNHFEDVFDQMETHGGNCMRLWLHTNGAHTPEWNGNMVTGPGAGTIDDLRRILDEAWERKIGMMLCLWSFDMQRTEYGPTITDRARAILTQQENRTSYIENSLIPMVQALKGHPAIQSWEIFNEPEGMSNEFGWNFTRHVPMAAIQAFVNQCAGAIKRTDPEAQVTNGSWSFFAATDVGEGNFNYYRDDRLIAAGGDDDGTLDFYCVHYYDWAGTERSPFHHDASHWGLDKPLVVAEFYPGVGNNCNNCGTAPHQTLFDRGYAGALSWSWTDSSPQAMLDHIQTVADAYPGAIAVVGNDFPEVSITSPISRTTFPDPMPVTIETEVSDADGTISKVEFFVGDSKIGERTVAPWSLTWTAPENGAYFFTAKATDNDGNMRSSEVVIIYLGVVQTRYEAEDASYSGNVSLITDSGASSEAGLYMTDNGTITWTVNNVPVAGSYDLEIGYQLPFDYKEQLLSINGGPTVNVPFEEPAQVWQAKTVPVVLAAGSNTIEIQKSWGFMSFDYIELPGLQPTTPAPPVTVEATVSFSGNQLSYTFESKTGKTYQIQSSTTLSNWTAAAGSNAMPGNGSMMNASIPIPSDAPIMFFRLQER